LHGLDVAGEFTIRQGLWIEDLQTPPEQECSNGSLILLALVLWRTFWQADLLSEDSDMKLIKVKTARFSHVIEKCGRPQVYTLWQKPAMDRHFQLQVRNHRVMTVQRTASGTDIGIIGFEESKGATYLVFPKSARRFADKRIVGIDWALPVK
jgi:hypothetical protein